jgi:hypothetical protein
MRCQFRFSDDVATCVFCGRSVRTKSRLIHAECRRGGPGTELSTILSGWPLYLHVEPGCQCKRHADLMDEWGCEVCESRMDEIVGWLKDEAASRGLPFVEVVARALIRRAIARARKKAA